jgi:hypothetical protein
MAEAAGLNPVQRGFDPRRGYLDPRLVPSGRSQIDSSRPHRASVRSIRLKSIPMPPRLEEDPDEPDEPDQPGPPGDGAIASSPIPSVGLPIREWEFATRVLTVAQVVDGSSLVKVLKEAGADGWELAEVVDGGEKRVLLMRRPKRSAQEARRVGFAPPKPN